MIFLCQLFNELFSWDCAAKIMRRADRNCILWLLCLNSSVGLYYALTISFSSVKDNSPRPGKLSQSSCHRVQSCVLMQQWSPGYCRWLVNEYNWMHFSWRKEAVAGSHVLQLPLVWVQVGFFQCTFGCEFPSLWPGWHWCHLKCPVCSCNCILLIEDH